MTMGGFSGLFYVYFFPMSIFCVLFWNFYAWKHYSDIELGVVGAGTLMIVL